MSIENITVFTDASFCPNTRAAGGAVWARGEQIRFQDSFPIRHAAQAHEAEILAVCHAIQKIAEHPELGAELRKGPMTRLVIVVDCLAVKQAFEQEIRAGQIVKEAIRAAMQLREQLGFWLKVNHVKAHKGTDTPRQWVNHWCDRHAKAQMRQMRAAGQH
ncbi:hypothetical protein IPC102_09600 [Pseudomonas aeruginosa]|uniref:ribonuclease HI n=1 Tax=Pseudomonas aeruginosa TaxID=287 RepID=UPI000F535F08|nr:RNase H family protein [Pseudomonas aeruginosa]RQH70016.1 hypothetical protein IPC102_09600 [Pseudomonas aeruginosa]